VILKGGRSREVLLSPEALAVLHEVPRTGSHVFDTTNYRNHFDAALRAAGVEDFHWHDLRHSFATWLGQSGAPLEVIRDQLGHSSISVTQKYRHVVGSEVRAALQKLPTISPNSTNVRSLKRP
jgi:integrase